MIKRIKKLFINDSTVLFFYDTECFKIGIGFNTCKTGFFIRFICQFNVIHI